VGRYPLYNQEVNTMCILIHWPGAVFVAWNKVELRMVVQRLREVGEDRYNLTLCEY
jgi:hypothetical protein